MSTHGKNTRDLIYDFDKNKLDQLRRDRPWKKHPKYFTNCKINIIAVTKMIKHAIYGLNNGLKKHGMGNQVMGFLIGRPQLSDPQNAIKYELLISGYIHHPKINIIIPTEITHLITIFYPYHIFCERFESNTNNTIIITDCIETPINDCESRVVADDERVSILMLKMEERLKLCRKGDSIIGWYHSVPMQGALHYMRAQKINTQQLWQMYGIWVGIKIDPIKCLSTKKPQFVTFRTYPVNYEPINKFEAPDGTIYETYDDVIKQWGRNYDRYYYLKNKYFMSSMIKYSLDVIYKHDLYIQQLTSVKIMESEYRAKLPKTIQVIAKKTDLRTMDEAIDISKDMVIDHCIGSGFQWSKYKTLNYKL